MIHLKRLLISFFAAWGLSIAALLGVVYLPETGREVHRADPTGDWLQVLRLLSAATFMCVGAAWMLIAVPFYFSCLRDCGRLVLFQNAVVAGMIGFLFMVFATRILPVAEASSMVTAPIAFVVAFCGVLVMRCDLIFPGKRGPKGSPGERALSGGRV